MTETDHKTKTAQDFSQWMNDLGAIMYLVDEAKVQRQYPLAVLRARIFPSLWHRQYHLLWKEGLPVAFVNWAWLSDSLAMRYKDTQCYLEPNDWKSGANLWFMEILYSADHLNALIADLRHIIPPATEAHWHEVTEIGTHSAKLRHIRFPDLPTSHAAHG
jgi:cytolysin-activating lysine-acyltransferase